MRNDAALLTPEELAERLRLPVATIYQWRYRGLGPRGYKVGRHVRYKPTDVDAWLEQQASTPRDAA